MEIGFFEAVLISVPILMTLLIPIAVWCWLRTTGRESLDFYQYCVSSNWDFRVFKQTGAFTAGL